MRPQGNDRRGAELSLGRQLTAPWDVSFVTGHSELQRADCGGEELVVASVRPLARDHTSGVR